MAMRIDSFCATRLVERAISASVSLAMDELSPSAAEDTAWSTTDSRSATPAMPCECIWRAFWIWPSVASFMVLMRMVWEVRSAKVDMVSTAEASSILMWSSICPFFSSRAILAIMSSWALAGSSAARLPWFSPSAALMPSFMIA